MAKKKETDSKAEGLSTTYGANTKIGSGKATTGVKPNKSRTKKAKHVA